MSIKFYISTLGCKVNQYESQALRESWKELGWCECASPKQANLLLVNSCAVTASAVADVRAQVRRLHALAPEAQILVMGCSAEVQAAEMRSLPGVSKVIGAAEKNDFYYNPTAFFEPQLLNSFEVEQSSQPPEETLGQTLEASSLVFTTPLAKSSNAPPKTSAKIAPATPLPKGEKAPTKRFYPPFAVNDYNRARAVLKVQDGCSHFCTYCIVPLARGGTVSRNPQEVLQEVQRLVEAGFKEITLSGINLSQYSWRDDENILNHNFQTPKQENARQQKEIILAYKQEKKRFDFWDLILFLEQHLMASFTTSTEELTAGPTVPTAGLTPSLTIGPATGPAIGPAIGQRNPGLENTACPSVQLASQVSRQAWGQQSGLPIRLRISSLEPGQLDKRALQILGQSKLICPQLHISLQSGSPSVLKRMGRGHYNPHDLLEFCSELKKAWPQFGLGADLLVGFPGESEEEFEETKSLIQALPFTYAHVFPFSARPGTKAASFPHAVPKPVRSKRAAILREIVEKKKQAFLQLLLAQAQPLHMILESQESGLGVCEYYVECRLLQIPPKATPEAKPEATPEAKPKDCLKVTPVAIEGESLLVKICC